MHLTITYMHLTINYITIIYSLEIYEHIYAFTYVGFPDLVNKYPRY